jgi:hypothetical protein
LALLEDRIALDEGKKQKYGTQVKRSSNGRYHVEPIEDERNVDKRRTEM